MLLLFLVSLATSIAWAILARSAYYKGLRHGRMEMKVQAASLGAGRFEADQDTGDTYFRWRGREE